MLFPAEPVTPITRSRRGNRSTSMRISVVIGTPCRRRRAQKPIPSHGLGTAGVRDHQIARREIADVVLAQPQLHRAAIYQRLDLRQRLGQLLRRLQIRHQHIRPLRSQPLRGTQPPRQIAPAPSP